MGQSGIKASAIFKFPSKEVIKEMLVVEEFNSLNQLRKEAYKQVGLMICEALYD